MKSAASDGCKNGGLVVRFLRRVNIGLIAFVVIAIVCSYFEAFTFSVDRNEQATAPKQYRTSFVLGWVHSGGVRVSWGTHALPKEYSVEPKKIEFDWARESDVRGQYAGYPYQKYTLLFSQWYQGRPPLQNAMYTCLDTGQSISDYSDHRKFGFQYSHCWVSQTLPTTTRVPILQSVTFPLVILLIPSGIIMLWLGRQAIIRKMRSTYFPDQCLSCGYNLSGIRTQTMCGMNHTTCPECGHLNT